MLDVMLAAVGVLAVATGVSSRVLRELPLSPPLLALALGVLIGPVALDLVVIPTAEHQTNMETASRLLLAVALMAIALRYPIRQSRQRARPVALLILVVMPAMAIAVAVLATLTIGTTLAAAVAVGAALSPTDPVLASSVVTGEPAERDIPARLRQVLSLESAANDGLALPLVMIGGALAAGLGPVAEFGRGLLEVLWGGALGGAMGLAAGKLMRAAREHRDIEASAMTLFAMVLAFAVLGVVSIARGNEVLAVFVAGLAYITVVTGPERASEAEIDEGLNQFLVLPVFVLLGVVLPWDGWAQLGWAGVAFAVLVLLLRRLPWALLLGRPLELRVRDALWLGWFGPIGVAAVFYLGFLHRMGATDPVIWHAGTLVVAASTVAHGVTSVIGRRLYARAAEG